jgi:hypothetical protein
MVRMEKQGDSFVMITGEARKPDISVLCDELRNPSPDKTKIKEGLLYLEESALIDIRKELKTILQEAIGNSGLAITDL